MVFCLHFRFLLVCGCIMATLLEDLSVDPHHLTELLVLNFLIRNNDLFLDASYK